MREFVCGMLVEDGHVMYRKLDLMTIEMALKTREIPTKHFLNDYLLDKSGSVSCETALAKLKDLKRDISMYEKFFEQLKEVTPEWLNEHAEEFQ